MIINYTVVIYEICMVQLVHFLDQLMFENGEIFNIEAMKERI